MATAKKGHAGSRRGLTKEGQQKIADQIAEQIIKGYQVTDGCPPLSTQWGGYDLGKTDWLKRFAEQVVCEDKSLKAWNAVKGKCDSSFIIELLYL